jgi:alpha-glucan,water dikinase
MRTPGDHHQGHRHSATTGRIGRKNRDVMQLLSKNASDDQVNRATEATSAKSSGTFLDLFIKSLQEKHGSQVLCKKVFKLGENEILVSSERSSSKETYTCTLILYMLQASFHDAD